MQLSIKISTNLLSRGVQRNNIIKGKDCTYFKNCDKHNSEKKNTLVSKKKLVYIIFTFFILLSKPFIYDIIGINTI